MDYSVFCQPNLRPLSNAASKNVTSTTPDNAAIALSKQTHFSNWNCEAGHENTEKGIRNKRRYSYQTDGLKLCKTVTSHFHLPAASGGGVGFSLLARDWHSKKTGAFSARPSAKTNVPRNWPKTVGKCRNWIYPSSHGL